MKSWKTTLGGLLSAFGTALAAAPDKITHSIGVIIAAGGSLLLGIAARDNNVTSEEAGAK